MYNLEHQPLDHWVSLFTQNNNPQYQYLNHCSHDKVLYIQPQIVKQ